MSNQTDFTCCLCGKEITESWDRCNPDPLVAPDENDFIGYCCGVCNQHFVYPVRRILWQTDPCFIDRHRFHDEQKLNALIPYLQKMPLDALRKALDSEDPLAAFQSYKKSCQQQEHWFRLKKIFK